MAKPAIPKMWLNSTHHWFMGGEPNRRPKQIARINPNDPLRSLLTNYKDPTLPSIQQLTVERVRDPKVFSYSIEAISTRFCLDLKLGWFAVRLWRKWEDTNTVDWRQTTGYSFFWKRRCNLWEGENIFRRERTNSWWKDITTSSTTTRSREALHEDQ